MTQWSNMKSHQSSKVHLILYTCTNGFASLFWILFTIIFLLTSISVLALYVWLKKHCLTGWYMYMYIDMDFYSDSLLQIALSPSYATKAAQTSWNSPPSHQGLSVPERCMFVIFFWIHLWTASIKPRLLFSPNPFPKIKLELSPIECQTKYKLKWCSKKECCKQCRYENGNLYC